MGRRHLIPALVALLSAAVAAGDAAAESKWDGRYTGGGKIDVDKDCLPREFEAVGVIANNILSLSIKTGDEVVTTVKFKITARGIVKKKFLCTSKRMTAYAQGSVGDGGIKLYAVDIIDSRGNLVAGEGGDIILSRAPSQ